MRRLLLVAIPIAAASCKTSDRDPPPDPPPGPSRLDDAAPSPLPVDPERGDAAFRAAAEGLAARKGRAIAAWGTANLDDDPGAERFATLEPTGPAHEDGAYLLEDGDRRWVITFHADGRTQMFGVDPERVAGSDAAWTARAERAIEHVQGHRGGYESLVIGLRGGVPVVLRSEVLDDASETGAPRIADLAPGGVCARPCPPLADWVLLHQPSSIVSVEELRD